MKTKIETVYTCTSEAGESEAQFTLKVRLLRDALRADSAYESVDMYPQGASIYLIKCVYGTLEAYEIQQNLPVSAY